MFFPVAFPFLLAISLARKEPLSAAAGVTGGLPSFDYFSLFILQEDFQEKTMISLETRVLPLE